MQQWALRFLSALNPMSLPDAVLIAFATWRLSFMLVSEDGPFRIFIHLRKLPHGGLLDCLYCTSVWVALLLYAVWLTIPELIYVLAFSAGALLLDKVVSE